MCGLVGMAGWIGQNESKMFRFMLEVDVVRGRDSTGVTWVDNQWGVTTEKDVGPPQNLWDFNNKSKFNSDGLFKFGYRVVIGHNRAATIGKVTQENAHPFTFGSVTGAHNGTLYDWSDLEGYKELDVDSKGLINTIDLKGIEHTWKNFTGAAALTWYDEKDQTINLIRNEERPLCWAQTTDEKTLFWASEPWMIVLGAQKAGVKLKPIQDKDGKDTSTVCTSLTPHHHYSWKPDFNVVVQMEGKELEKKSYLITRSNGYYTKSGPPTAGNGYGGYGGYGSKSYPTYTKNKSKKDKTPKLNGGWAKGLEKAGKEFRGQEIRLCGASAKSSTGFKTKQFGLFSTEDDIRVEVYPKTQKEFDMLYDQSMGDGIYKYKMLHRPRIRLNNLGIISALCISIDGIKLVSKVTPTHKGQAYKNTPRNNVEKLYPGPGGLLTKAGWESVADKLHPKSSCSCCFNPISIEDAEDVHWIDPSCAVCKECNKDTQLMYDLLYQKSI